MDSLLEIVRRENIYLAYKDLKSAGPLLGLYVNCKKKSIIILEQSLIFSNRSHRVALVHELGHHFFPPRSGIIAFQRSDFNRDMVICQDERKAMQYGTNHLMPTEEVWKAIKNGYDTIPLLSDLFNVTEWFVRTKIGFIRVDERERGNKLKWRNILNRPPSGGFNI
jgi:Zn-dependent peptidase ImmA (M78 family)